MTTRTRPIDGALFGEEIVVEGTPDEIAALLIAYDLEEHTGEEDERLGGQLAAFDLDTHMAISFAIIAAAKASYEPVATLGCYSGGNDSTTFMHLLVGQMDHAVHINTGIGIEATREFVRRTCAGWGLPLIEGHPPPGCTYRELVLAHGFPGPAQHGLMYSRLKERALRLVRKSFIGEKGRTKRVLFLSGMRRFESDRRFENTQVLHRDGAAVWCSPIAWWPDALLDEYRHRYDVPLNEVSVHLHMSGECLCGAYAKPGEKEMIRLFFPEDAARIDQLEAEVKAAGHVACVWGQRPPAAERSPYPDEVVPLGADPLCRKCLTLWEVEA